MAAHTERPIIMPLSNPTSRCEALPEDLIHWTDGRALVATGSPFPPVNYGDRVYTIAQANNALVFPGLGLGVTVARARRITDPLIAAASDAVARLSDAATPGSALLPPLTTCAGCRQPWVSLSSTPPSRKISRRSPSRTRPSRCTRPCGDQNIPISRSVLTGNETSRVSLRRLPRDQQLHKRPPDDYD